MAEESWTGEPRLRPALRDRLAALLAARRCWPPGPATTPASWPRAGVPTAMLFVRNPTGVSHSPAEFAEPADCLAGVGRWRRCANWPGYINFWHPVRRMRGQDAKSCPERVSRWLSRSRPSGPGRRAGALNEMEPARMPASTKSRCRRQDWGAAVWVSSMIPRIHHSAALMSAQLDVRAGLDRGAGRWPATRPGSRAAGRSHSKRCWRRYTIGTDKAAPLGDQVAGGPQVTLEPVPVMFFGERGVGSGDEIGEKAHRRARRSAPSCSGTADTPGRCRFRPCARPPRCRCRCRRARTRSRPPKQQTFAVVDGVAP